MIQYATDITGSLEGMKQRVKRVAKVITTIPHDTLHESVLRHTELVFVTQADITGMSWPDHSVEPIYEQRKRDKTGHARPGRWIAGEERLFPSWTMASHPEHIFRVINNEVIIGSSVPWASAFQSDTIGPHGEPSPARPVNVAGETTYDDWANDIQDAQYNQLKKQGLL